MLDQIGLMTMSVTYCSKMLDVPRILSQDTAQPSFLGTIKPTEPLYLPD